MVEKNTNKVCMSYKNVKIVKCRYNEVIRMDDDDYTNNITSLLSAVAPFLMNQDAYYFYNVITDNLDKLNSQNIVKVLKEYNINPNDKNLENIIENHPLYESIADEIKQFTLYHSTGHQTTHITPKNTYFRCGYTDDEIDAILELEEVETKYSLLLIRKSTSDSTSHIRFFCAVDDDDNENIDINNKYIDKYINDEYIQSIQSIQSIRSVDLNLTFDLFSNDMSNLRQQQQFKKVLLESLDTFQKNSLTQYSYNSLNTSNTLLIILCGLTTILCAYYWFC
jgi:hypothetical protein